VVELNFIKYLQLPLPAAFVIVGGILLHEAAVNPSLMLLYVPLALVSFGVGFYSFHWAVENTNRTLVNIERAKTRSRLKTENSLTRRMELKHASKVQEGQNIQFRKQAEIDKTVQKGIRRILDD